MAQDRSLLVELAGLLLDFAADVRQTLADPLRRAALGRDLGGVFAAPRAAQRALPPGSALLQRYVQQLDDDANALQVLQVLQALRGEFDALRTVLRSFTPDAPAPRDAAAALDEVYALALEVLATDYVRRQHPKLYFIMQFAGFATEAASPLGEGETTVTQSVSAVLGLLGLLFFGPEGPHWDWTTEADVRRTSPPLLRVPALLLTVLRLSSGLLKDWADQEWLDLQLGWDRVPGQQGVNAFADGVSDRLLTVRFREPTPLEDPDPDTRMTGAVTLGLVPRDHGGPGVFLGLHGHVDLKRQLTERLHLRVRLPAAQQGYVFGGGAHWIEAAAPRLGDLPLAAELSLEPPEGSTHLGSWPDSGSNRLSLGRLVLSAGLDAQGPRFDLSLHDCLLALDAGAVDGFLGSLLPDKSTAVHFSVGSAYSAEQGLHATGNLVDAAGGTASDTPRSGPADGNGFQPALPPLGSSTTGSQYEARIALGHSLGPVKLLEVSLGLSRTSSGAAPGLRLAAALAFSARIGPVTAVVDRLGLAVPITQPQDRAQANLHFVHAGLDLLPPTSVGIRIDAKAVQGGGFIRYDPVQKQYAGVLELEISRLVSVKALALIATRLPDGSKGYSLLVIITAEGFQPIRLPMGFALAGIGGLLALHRTFSEDVLREGLRDKTLDRILFPVDPVNNAPALLATLQRAFPAQRGSWLFGPMLRITWGVPTLVTMDLALIVEWGLRDRLLVLGRIVALLPEPDHPLLRLRMDALGVFDFDQGSAAIDAVLVDSQLLGRFALTGAMALRARWKSPRNFVLAVGGLHHAFTPPAGFPKLPRLALNLSTSDNPSVVCEAYFAITSNSVQFGAAAHFKLTAGKCVVKGDTGFDVLVQLSPFHFLAEFHAGMQITYRGHNLLKVTVDGALEGPRPLSVRAKASFEILWWDVSVNFSATLVDGDRPAPPPAVNVMQLLVAALSDTRNWHGALPAGQTRVVVLRERPAAAGVVAAHPLATLSVRQAVVPLNTAVALSRFGDAPVQGPARFVVKQVRVNGRAQPAAAWPALREDFAPAQFFDMPDEQKLTSAAFVPLDAGLEMAATAPGFTLAHRAEWDLRYETKLIDRQARPGEPRVKVRDKYLLGGDRLGWHALHGAAGRSVLRREDLLAEDRRAPTGQVKLNQTLPDLAAMMALER